MLIILILIFTSFYKISVFWFCLYKQAYCNILIFWIKITLSFKSSNNLTKHIPLLLFFYKIKFYFLVSQKWRFSSNISKNKIKTKNSLNSIKSCFFMYLMCNKCFTLANLYDFQFSLDNKWVQIRVWLSVLLYFL